MGCIQPITSFQGTPLWTCLLALGGLLCTAGYAERIGPIPIWADLMYHSTIHGEIDGNGLIPSQIYAADSRTSRTVRLSRDSYSYYHVSASPSRDRLAVVRILEDSNGNSAYDVFDSKGLYVIDLETGDETPLVEDYDPGWGGIEWTPDGESLISAMTLDWFNWEVYRIDPSENTAEALTTGLNAQLGIPGTRHWVSDAGISPDGEWIACIFSEPEGLGFVQKRRVIEFRIDGSQARFVTDGGPLPPGPYGSFGAGDFDPEFSPTQQSIVFARVTDVGFNGSLATSDIMLVDRTTLETTNLSGEGNTSSHYIPNFAADGRIVFTEWRSLNPSYIGPMVFVTSESEPERLWHGYWGTHAQWTELPSMKWREGTITSGGRERRFLWTAPDGPWTRGAIIALHGGGGHAENFGGIDHPLNIPVADFVDLAVAEGFAVLAPDSTRDVVTDGVGLSCGKRWDCIDVDRGNVDIPFLHDLLTKTIPSLRPPGSTPHRFLTGISNGGFMTILAASRLQNEISAFAPIACGDPYGTYMDMTTHPINERPDAPGVFRDNTTNNLINTDGAAVADEYTNEREWPDPPERRLPFRFFQHRQDGAVDFSCFEKAMTMLNWHGYTDTGAFVLDTGGQRDILLHFWQEDYNRPLVDFFIEEADRASRVDSWIVY